ncbi:MAG: hypothetical protein ABL986_10735 [Vicinamibacterales bacterium]
MSRNVAIDTAAGFLGLYALPALAQTPPAQPAPATRGASDAAMFARDRVLESFIRLWAAPETKRTVENCARSRPGAQVLVDSFAETG